MNFINKKIICFLTILTAMLICFPVFAGEDGEKDPISVSSEDQKNSDEKNKKRKNEIQDNSDKKNKKRKNETYAHSYTLPLPDDIIAHCIIRHLSNHDIKNTSLVNKYTFERECFKKHREYLNLLKKIDGKPTTEQSIEEYGLITNNGGNEIVGYPIEEMGSQLDDKSLKLLSQIITHQYSTITSLNLTNIKEITDKQFEILKNILTSYNCKVTKFQLTNCNSTVVIKLITDLLNLSKCKINSLHLVMCNITPKDTKLIADVLKNAKVQITTLELSINPMGDEGTKYILQALGDPNCHVNNLILQGNNITSNCVKDITAALINESKTQKDKIKVLDLSNNELSNTDVEQLFITWQSPICAMTELKLNNNNKVDDNVLQHVADYIKNNQKEWEINPHHLKLLKFELSSQNIEKDWSCELKTSLGNNIKYIPNNFAIQRTNIEPLTNLNINTNTQNCKRVLQF